MYIAGQGCVVEECQGVDEEYGALVVGYRVLANANMEIVRDLEEYRWPEVGSFVSSLDGTQLTASG